MRIIKKMKVDNRRTDCEKESDNLFSFFFGDLVFYTVELELSYWALSCL